MRPVTITVNALLLLAGFVWLGLIAIAADMPSIADFDPSNLRIALSAGLIVLWILLAATTLMAGVSVEADLSSKIFVGLLLLGSVAVGLATVHLCRGIPSPWMLAAIFAPPPVVASLVITMRSPKLNAAASPLLTNGLWCALIALTLLPCPFVAREARLSMEPATPLQAVHHGSSVPEVVREEKAPVRHLVILAADQMLRR